MHVMCIDHVHPSSYSFCYLIFCPLPIHSSWSPWHSALYPGPTTPLFYRGEETGHSQLWVYLVSLKGCTGLVTLVKISIDTEPVGVPKERKKAKMEWSLQGLDLPVYFRESQELWGRV